MIQQLTRSHSQYKTAPIGAPKSSQLEVRIPSSETERISNMKKSGSKREFNFDSSFAEDEEESLAQPDKKRRLGANQVKALEQSFEAENKLEPERKERLAIELGLDPRQVAIWFQNRRARWKTKQLERDYSSLQSAFDDLKHRYDAVKRLNETLIQQIEEMKANSDLMISKKEEMVGVGDFDFNYETAFHSKMNVVSSDSATSGVQNEENGISNGVVSSYEMLANENDQRFEIWPTAGTYSFLSDEDAALLLNWL